MNFKRFSIGIIGLILVLTGCSNPAGGGNENNGNNGNNNGNKTAQKLTVGYMSNFMVEIGDATGLGIFKRTANGNRSARVAADEADGKFYLVKTTVDFSHGNVEWNESGLTNVTFKKKTTVDETVYIPQVDEEGNPVLDEEGNPVYEIVENQTVTQDEIPAQVNRLYAHNTFTYIQFIPNDTYAIPDTRPADLGTIDQDGYFAYDKRDYYNDDYHQSFVIENSTGNIYSVENAVYIETIHNGLLKIKDSPYIWDARIKANDELEIFTLFQNTAIWVNDYFKDKFGNNYISNDLLNTTVPETNTVFFKYAPSKNDSTYMIATNNGDVVYANGDLNTYWTDPANSNSQNIGATQLRIMGANLTTRPVDSNDYLEFNNRSFIKNKEWYFWSGSNDVLIVNTDTAAIKHYIECRLGGLYSSYDYYNTVLYDTVLIRDGYGTIIPAQLPYDKLYYYKFDFNSLPVSDEPYYYDISIDNYGSEYSGHCQAFGAGLKLLLENLDYDTGRAVGPWKKTTINGQEEYIVIIQEIAGEKVPVAVKSSEYMAEEQQTIILKPINR
jgi:hypothetical protein